MTEQPPYLAFEVRRAVEATPAAPRIEATPVAAPAQVAVAAPAPAAPVLQPQAAEPRFDRAAFFASLPSASQIAAAQPVINIPPAPVQPVEAVAPVQAQGIAAQARAQALQQLQAQQAQVSAQIAAQAQISGLRPAFDIPRTPASQSNLMPQHADLATYQAQFQSPAPIAAQQSAAPMAQPAPAPLVQVAQPQQVAQRAPVQPRSAEAAQILQQSIARIHEACQAPPLSPPEYRVLFDSMAAEISEQGLLGAQTLVNIVARAQSYGIELRRDDVRFALEVVSEADPWFEQGASPNLLAGRFRNYVVARCRGQGLTLTPDELDLIDAWFAGLGQPPVQQRMPQQQQQVQQPRQRQPTITAPSAERWWNQAPEAAPDYGAAEEFPRIVKNRLRG